jgi:hypothetical protein
MGRFIGFQGKVIRSGFISFTVDEVVCCMSC